MNVAASEGRLRLPLLGLATCYGLSGFCALLYQVAWTRQFAITFGTAESAVAAVLAAYMGGLALGAALARRLAARLASPLRAYAWMELAIAACAVVLVPALLQGAGRLLALLFGQQPDLPTAGQAGVTLYHLLTAFAVLAPPTVLMGATLPVLARHAVQADEQLGGRIGALYAINTAGAVCGALVASLWLLPSLGLRASCWVGAALNVLVALLAAAMARHAPAPTDAAAPARAAASTSETGPAALGRCWPWARRAWVLPLVLASGAVSFAYEVLWTRMLGQLLGGSVHAFGIMLASFLSGIALGAAIGGWLAANARRASLALAAMLLASAAAGWLAWLGIDALPVQATTFAARSLLGFALLLPLATAIGATYPLAVRVLARGAGEASAASARVYAWNTAGAIAGSLSTAFLWLPLLRYEGTLQLLVSASALLALLASLLLARPPVAWLAAATVACGATCVLVRPGPPGAFLRASALRLPASGELTFYAVGRSASVVVLEADGRYLLRSNGLPEASIDPRGAVRRISGEAWMPALAALARPQARSELVIGFGSGRVVADTPDSVRDIEVVELEPRILEANRAISSLRASNPLADPRLRVIDNDARGALALSDRRFDAILSQPSHPWTAGASHLYTLEFLRQARDHLVPGGVLVQWMNAAFIDEPLLRSMLATLKSVFGEVRVYRPDPETLLFLASTERLEPERLLRRSGLPAGATQFTAVGISSAEDLAAALVLDADGVRTLARGAAPITDDDNRLATAGAQLHGSGLAAGELGRLLAPFDPLARPDALFDPDGAQPPALGYLAQRLAAAASRDPSAVDRLGRLAQATVGQPLAPVIEYTLARVRGEPVAALAALRAAAARPGASDEVRFARLEADFAAATSARPPPELQAQVLALGPEAHRVLEAARAASRGDFAAVASVDGMLAAVAPTRPWAGFALQLRVEWRVRVQDAQARPRLCAEGLAILDDWLAVEPNVSLYALRAWAAAGSGRADAVVESIAGFARVARETDDQLSGPTRVAVLQSARSLQQLLHGVPADPGAIDGASRERIDEVAVQLADGIARLEATRGR